MSLMKLQLHSIGLGIDVKVDPQIDEAEVLDPNVCISRKGLGRVM